MNDGLKTFVNDTKKILKTRIAPIILATFITTNSLEVANALNSFNGRLEKTRYNNC